MFNGIYKNKRVFITGHTGFKGSWLTQWLLMQGAQVSGFALPPAYPDSHFELLNLKDQIDHNVGDIRNGDEISSAIKKAAPDIVFHLAAQALVREAYQNPKYTFDTNVGGAVNLLEAVRESDSIKALVFITSDKCYRNKEWEWGYREPDQLGGKDPYSSSKGCAELVFYSYFNSFLQTRPGLRVSTTRAGNVIGGGDWAKDRIVPDCIRALTKKEPIVLRHPESTRPWQHVLEPLGGYLLLGQQLLENNPSVKNVNYNFGPDKTSNKPVQDLVEKMISIWGSGTVEVNAPKDAPHEDNLLQLNCDRSWHELAWKPTWHFDMSVTETAKWYKAHYQQEDISSYTKMQIEKYEKDFSKNID